MARTYDFWITALRTWIIRRTLPLTDWQVSYDGIDPTKDDNSEWQRWAHPESPCRHLTTTSEMPWDEAGLFFDVDGETLLRINGLAAYGLNPFHQRYYPKASAGTSLCITLDQVTTGLMGVPAASPGIHRAAWIETDATAETCYWDLSCLVEWAEAEGTPTHLKRWLHHALDEALNPLYALSPDETAIRAYTNRHPHDAEEEGLVGALNRGPVEGLLPIERGTLDAHLEALHENLTRIYEELGHLAPKSPGTLVMMGHAHIDLAWLWPMQETHRKVIRTVASQSHLLERYPDWIFGMSSPEMWEVLQEEPELYARWVELSRANRVSALGAFWVESDSQLAHGVAIIRHLLYGLRYFERVTGKRPQLAFLPDTFGFSGALPTLLAKAGIRLFATTKINWNDTNRFPYKDFRWIGPDGSEVQGSLFGSSPDGYNGKASINDLRAAFHQYAESGVQSQVLYAMGHGDGGGGTDESMLERLTRYRKLPLLPELTHTSVETLIAERNWDQLPKYRGDLYLEYHRGVYTAQSQVKSQNRYYEIAVTAMEAWSALTGDTTSFEPWWRKLLRNQFHDILPGSSIHAVYEDFSRDMQAIQRGLDAAQEKIEARLWSASHSLHLLVGNRSLFPRPQGTLEVPHATPFSLYWNDAWHSCRVGPSGHFFVDIPEVPALALATFPMKEQSHDEVSSVTSTEQANVFHFHGPETDIEIGPAGITQFIYRGREILKGAAGIVAFFQHPDQFDAWELVEPRKRGYVSLTHDLLQVTEWNSRHATVTLTHHVGPSTIIEHIALDKMSDDITISCEMTLRERHLAIQYAIPTTIVTSNVTRETLWGTDLLPTEPGGPSDVARFEWVAHRFVDLSEPHFGLALANDGRYGHFVDGGTLTLTLATTPLYPDPSADSSPSPARLLLSPHHRHWTEDHLLAKAYAFSHPPLVAQGYQEDPQPTIVNPLQGLPENIALVGLKGAEDGSGDLIYYLGEMWGDDCEATVTWPVPVAEVAYAEMISESSQTPITVSDNISTVHLAPRSLVVIRARPKGKRS